MAGVPLKELPFLHTQNLLDNRTPNNMTITLHNMTIALHDPFDDPKQCRVILSYRLCILRKKIKWYSIDRL